MSAEAGAGDVRDAMALLRELALDLRWSWNHASDELWDLLEPELWARTHNPWVVLQTLSPKRLAPILGDPVFRARLERLVGLAREAAQRPTWFEQTHADSNLGCVGYLSMEFMLSEALPIYAGGLGNVAGDQLKAASDLGVPVVGVSLLYQHGYFRQVIAADGSQQVHFPYNDPGQLPITPLRGQNGEWLRLEITFPGYGVAARLGGQVGRLHLYLLDSNDAANYPADRGITGELYGGGPRCGCSRKWCWGLEAGGCSRRWALSPTCAT